MPSALVLISPGFEEIEAITVINLLRRASIDVTTAGMEKNIVTGSHQISIQPDQFYKDCNHDDFDILILPGGQPGTNNMKKDSTILEWIRQRFDSKKWLAAVCAAPTVLHEAGVTDGLNLTSYPSERGVFNANHYSENPVVIDGHVITGRGVGASIDFSLAIIDVLLGKETANDIAEKILHHR